VRAYEDLVRRHQDVAFRVAQLVAGNAADAEDAAQEAMVKAYYALDRFREDAPFRPWLLRIVANEASNRRRSSGAGLSWHLRCPPSAPRETWPRLPRSSLSATSSSSSSSPR
jgi:RNA polymerase sigma-70 factor (ECF subfamily)